MKERSLQAASLLLLLGVWMLLASIVGRDVLPGPPEAAESLWELLSSGRFLEPLGRSFVRVVLGFLLGFAVGVGYGIAAARSRRFERATLLLTLSLLFAPTLVVIFVGILLLGSNNAAAVLIAGLLIFPELAIYITSVMRDMDQDIVAMADAFKVKTLDRVTGIYLPFLVPPMLSATRMGFAHAWKIVFLAEAFGLSGGLGFEVRQSYGIYDLSSVIAWLAIFIIVVLALEQLLRRVEHRFVRWQP
jgi:ABC-type nitrate/sulfonate/bicarbonate transport system permease component